MDVLNYKCPRCGAPLVFDAQAQKVVCASCSSAFEIEQVKEYNEAAASVEVESQFDWKAYRIEEDNVKIENMEAYSCPSCGAEVAGDANTIATECLYCGNPTLIQAKATGMLKPDFIIPFKLDKKAAKEALKNFYKGKFLLPKFFQSANHIEKITGVYVPFWLFDCETDANIVYDATKVKTWSDTDYNHVKTSYYMIQREGEMAFEKIPVDGSIKMDDAYMDAIEPYDYHGMVAFNSPYLTGYLADKFDVDVQDSIKRANERVSNSSETELTKTVHGYQTLKPRDVNIKILEGDVKYALLPVWMLNTKFEGKVYTFAMNGQTGKLVGELPTDKKRFWGLFAGITAGIALLSQLVILLMK